MEMRLCAIVNIWDDWDWLEILVKNLKPLVDGFIIVASEKSNWGEFSPIPDKWKSEVYHREPVFNHPMNSETDKRNYGLDMARIKGYTHFLACDADELYEPESFLKAKERFEDPNLKGLVVPCNVYFKSPTLTVGRDITLVPFIHELTPRIKHEFNRKYPFSWDNLRRIRIDPTRSFNITSGVEYTEDVVCEHYSWVRKDYEKKIRNSTARNNIQKSNILNNLVDAKEGSFCEFYGKRLTRCPNLFGIPEYVSNPEGTAIFREDLQPGAAGDRLHLPD